MKTFKELFPVFSYWCGKKLELLSTLFYRKNPKNWSVKTYKRKFGIRLNLDNPTTFYEKMNYWKHNYYDNQQSLLTDKLLVKDYLTEKGHGELVAKVLFSSEKVSDLKKWLNGEGKKYKQYVIKTSHSCGDVFIVNNGTITRKEGRKYKNLRVVLRILRIGMRFNHYYSRFELNYKNLKPQVYVEEFIPFDANTIEYEFMCNYGNIVFVSVVRDRQVNKGTTVFVDEDFKDLESETKYDSIVPSNYAFIKKFINDNCLFFPFCRVDFIFTNNKLYFCEFTFCKSGGLNKMETPELDIRLGNQFKL